MVYEVAFGVFQEVDGEMKMVIHVSSFDSEAEATAFKRTFLTRNPLSSLGISAASVQARVDARKKERPTISPKTP